MSYNKKYSNGDITVYWQPELCVHAAVCVSELPRVFNSRRRPWIDLSQGKTESIISTINSCPTGALMFRWNDESRNATETSHKLLKGEEESKSATAGSDAPSVKVKLHAHGPAVITGSYELETESGSTEQREYPCAICRCGKSKNMPFCDGSHAE
jgi:uncharacterized Fe-S cluster protein YjdI